MDNNLTAALAAAATLLGYTVQFLRSWPQVNNTLVNYGIVVAGALLYAWANKFHLAYGDPLTYVAAFQWITSIRGSAAFAHDMGAAPNSAHAVPTQEVAK